MRVLVSAAIMAMVAGLVAGLFWGARATQDVLCGAAIVLFPSIWVALCLTSGRGLVFPVWLAATRFGLAGCGFAVLFALRPDSQLIAVLVGSVFALFVPPLLLLWQGFRDGVSSGEDDKN